MPNIPWRTTIAALALLATASLARAQDATTKDEGRPGNRAVTDGRGGTEVLIDDQVFVSQALATSHGQIELAELALRKTTNPDVRAYAERTLRAYDGVRTELANATTAEGIDKPLGPDASHVAAKAELEQLEGAAFDRRYVTIVVDEQEEAAAMVTAKHRTGDGDVVAIANRLVSVVQQRLEAALELDRDLAGSADPRYGSTGPDAR